MRRGSALRLVKYDMKNANAEGSVRKTINKQEALVQAGVAFVSIKISINELKDTKQEETVPAEDGRES